MKILVPTDFSKTAAKALQYAVACYRQPGTTLLLYHAFRPFESGFYSPGKSREENNATEEELNEGLALKARQAALQSEDMVIQPVVERGHVERTLLKYAAAQHVDLIIMGTTGASGLKEKILGSVTADIMNKAQYPVIGIPAAYQPKPPAKIAFCSSYHLEDIPALKYLSTVLKQFGAALQIWHFDKKPPGTGAENKLSKEYRLLANNMMAPQHIEFHFVETANIDHALNKLARKKDLDMLVMITHRRNGFFENILRHSLTKQVAYHSQIPLMALPNDYLR